MTDEVKAPCCSCSHNLDIVRRQLNEAEHTIRQLRRTVDDLEKFQRLVWILVDAQMARVRDGR